MAPLSGRYDSGARRVIFRTASRWYFRVRGRMLTTSPRISLEDVPGTLGVFFGKDCGGNLARVKKRARSKEPFAKLQEGLQSTVVRGSEGKRRVGPCIN